MATVYFLFIVKTGPAIFLPVTSRPNPFSVSPGEPLRQGSFSNDPQIWRLILFVHYLSVLFSLTSGRSDWWYNRCSINQWRTTRCRHRLRPSLKTSSAAFDINEDETLVGALFNDFTLLCSHLIRSWHLKHWSNLRPFTKFNTPNASSPVSPHSIC